jgi:hypothetical protein
VRTSLHQQTAELRGLGVGNIGNLVNGTGKGKSGGGVIGKSWMGVSGDTPCQCCAVAHPSAVL